jgi:REP element-mobilizing transposase RayT
MPEYQRRLPHLQPEDATLFLTWRLYGSEAAARRPLLKTDPRPGHRFVAQDRELDRALAGPKWLKDTRIADFVAYTIKAGESERGFYKLHAWVIMPNHVHLLITPHVPLPVVTRWLKGSTARKANQILGLTGQPFWLDESWDHWVRRTESLNRTQRYIGENPVTAGLVPYPGLWRWSSATGQPEPPAPP